MTIYFQIRGSRKSGFYFDTKKNNETSFLQGVQRFKTKVDIYNYIDILTECMNYYNNNVEYKEV